MDLKDVIVSGLRTNKLSVPIIADFAFENILPRFVKDSYDDIWEDFLEEDVAEALTHALQEINIGTVYSELFVNICSGA